MTQQRPRCRLFLLFNHAMADLQFIVACASSSYYYFRIQRLEQTNTRTPSIHSMKKTPRSSQPWTTATTSANPISSTTNVSVFPSSSASFAATASAGIHCRLASRLSTSGRSFVVNDLRGGCSSKMDVSQRVPVLVLINWEFDEEYKDNQSLRIVKTSTGIRLT